MDSSSWELKEFVKGMLTGTQKHTVEMFWQASSYIITFTILGPQKITEICGQMIMDRVSHLKQFPIAWLQRQVDISSSLETIPYSNMLSSFAAVQDGIIVCDTGKLYTESSMITFV